VQGYDVMAFLALVPATIVIWRIWQGVS